jgi:hypothetical protein
MVQLFVLDLGLDFASGFAGGFGWDFKRHGWFLFGAFAVIRRLPA